MDTTSNALSVTLWRLAQDQEVQQKVRQEIFDAQDAQGGGDIGYDDLVSLPLLDAVCRETLRLYVSQSSSIVSTALLTALSAVPSI